MSNSKFNFSTGGQQVRIVLIDGYLWFSGEDIAEILFGPGEVYEHLRRLSPFEKVFGRSRRIIEDYDTKLISESGVYKLIQTTAARSPSRVLADLIDFINHEIRPTGDLAQTAGELLEDGFIASSIRALRAKDTLTGEQIEQLEQLQVLRAEAQRLQDENAELRFEALPGFLEGRFGLNALASLLEVPRSILERELHRIGMKHLPGGPLDEEYADIKWFAVEHVRDQVGRTAPHVYLPAAKLSSFLALWYIGRWPEVG